MIKNKKVIILLNNRDSEEMTFQQGIAPLIEYYKVHAKTNGSLSTTMS